MTTNRFSFRTFTSFMLTWSFLVLILSGSILYIAPPGRIANWSIWRLLILTKAQWQAIHTLTALIFLTGGLFHLLKFNWKTFWPIWRKRVNRAGAIETSWRLRLCSPSSCWAELSIELQPFAYVVAAGETLKNSWATPADEPPIPHLETVDMNRAGRAVQGTCGNVDCDPERKCHAGNRSGTDSDRAGQRIWSHSAGDIFGA